MMDRTETYCLLDTLCPLHFVISDDGRMSHAGPTFVRLFDGKDIIGRDILELIEVIRPRGIDQARCLSGDHGRRIKLALRQAPYTELSGALQSLGASGETLAALSFGIGLVDAVRDHGLNAADFAVTDPSIEMLYLVEAKSAAMDLSKRLNIRLEQARNAAEQKALSDPLTGLANRNGLQAALAGLTATDSGFALMHVDLDFFKAVNDTHGHAAGDAILCHVAEAMRGETRQSDVVARVGGDEFVILLVGLQDHPSVDRIAARLIRAIENPLTFGAARCRVSCSIGTVLSDDYARPDPDRMLADADAALYSAKAAGRAAHRFHRPLRIPEMSGQTFADRG